MASNLLTLMTYRQQAVVLQKPCFQQFKLVRNRIGMTGRQLNILVAHHYFMVLEAKCAQCGRKAEVDDDMAEVKCKYCGFHISYDEYIEIMKGKAVNIADDFQMNLDRRPF